MTRQKPTSISATISSDAIIQNKIESICEQGCTVVRQTIEIIEASNTNNTVQTSDYLKETTSNQRLEILEELKTIMAVYDNEDCNDN